MLTPDPSELDVYQKPLLEFIRSRLPVLMEITPETALIEEELLDSLLIMDVVSFVESRFDVRLGPGDVAPRNFSTVSAIARLVRTKREES